MNLNEEKSDIDNGIEDGNEAAKGRRKILLGKALLLILTLAVMFFIFQMSAMNAENSSELSTSVGYTVGTLFVEGFDELPHEEQEEFALSIEHPLRKFAHFSEFAALGFLLLFDATVFFGIKGWKRFLCAFLCGMIYAATDELHQLVVSGRSGEIRDVAIDTGGVLAGCIVAYLIIAVACDLRDRRLED